MAKSKKKNGESSAGLVVTLVIFILTTLGLGVATYYGFAEQATLKDAKDKAEAATKQAETDKSWYRFQANLYRSYMGFPPPDANAQEAVKSEKLTVDSNGQSSGKGQKDYDDVKGLIAKLDSTMKWDPRTAPLPKVTYETRLADKDRAYAALEKVTTQLRADREAAERRAAEAEALAKEQKKNFDAALVNLDTKVNTDRTDDRNQITKLRNELDTLSKGKEKESTEKADALKKLASSTKAQQKMETEVSAIKKDRTELQDRFEETKGRLTTLYSKTGVDPKAVEAESLDAKATQALKNWRKDWKIIMMDRQGKMPYINLGSADGLTSQLTFSIHSAGSDGRLSPTPKGTLEVIQVVDSHLARARITSVRDDKADPIVKGDKLFNPTWDPTLKKHVAVTGLIDLAGDGRDASAEFLRMLERQGVVVDAYLDMKDLTEKGKGIGVNTDYLIVGDNFDLSGVDIRGRDKDQATKLDRAIRSMRDKAQSNGVTVIGFRKYLDMIGYRPPQVTSPDNRPR